MEEREEETMHQGLCIGNSTEGFFANIYLARIDQDMGQIEQIDFGRYNDDMRMFAKDRLTAKRAMLALQERLLMKGLNLNSSKTEFVEGEVEIERLRTKAYESDEYFGDEEDAEIVRPKIADKPFDEFDKDFALGQKITTAKDAKDFCHFLSKRLELTERKPGHVEMLHEILIKWHGSAKHAAWRLVESFASQECPKETRGSAETVIIKCLTNPSVANYTKYRLLHHLVKTRGMDSKYRYSTQLGRDTLRKLKDLLPSFLGEVAFELNIISLYTMRALGASFTELESAVDQHACKPVPLPIRNALTLARGPKRAKLLPVFAQVGDEETEVEDYY
jgi:hypothetical protein